MSFAHNIFWQWTPHCWHEENRQGSIASGKHYTKRRRCCQCQEDQVYTWGTYRDPEHGKYGPVEKSQEMVWITVVPAGMY